ncbi:GTP cyclohydrolase FolE2 [Suttonella ornithocola]|uniref:GTP cyclohydrolase FolE2 n=1 Tax=Suttonella ornithocola TaxID=279832 RepID=A0A380MS64_9GAMM|nr:GTP cyclohydrolase FolE2 [Suttonella ornithocola]SUO94743.1 GTP cyclohydrolase folE2 [Suttonella ornithocola]
MVDINSIPDIQGTPDKRELSINRVGIRDIRIPFAIKNHEGNITHTVAEVEMTVSLPHDKKGTHMSRFIHLLNETACYQLSALDDLHAEMLKRLNALEGTIILDFPYFVEKLAPISKTQSLMEYQVSLTIDGSMQEKDIVVEVTVPVTSLCPCSKEISQYGAHNQRSHIIITALYDADNPFFIEELIYMGEKGGSCPIWATLKRPDEKYVTEHAYENPKFVEDIVRDVAIMLNEDDRILAYTVSSENFESIHNHSAYAIIKHDKRL